MQLTRYKRDTRWNFKGRQVCLAVSSLLRANLSHAFVPPLSLCHADHVNAYVIAQSCYKLHEITWNGLWSVLFFLTLTFLSSILCRRTGSDGNNNVLQACFQNREPHLFSRAPGATMQRGSLLHTACNFVESGVQQVHIIPIVWGRNSRFGARSLSSGTWVRTFMQYVVRNKRGTSCVGVKRPVI